MLRCSTSRWSLLTLTQSADEYIAFRTAIVVTLHGGGVCVERTGRTVLGTVYKHTNKQTQVYSKGAIILQRKRTRMRHRLKWIHSILSCMFILGSDKDQRNFRFRVSFCFNVISFNVIEHPFSTPNIELKEEEHKSVLDASGVVA